jgi:hypothetical protein
MRSIQLRPEYTIVLKYDIQSNAQEAYYRYIMGEFVPTLQTMGIYMYRAWEIVYGNYPERQIEFITEIRDIREVIEGTHFTELEERLKSFTENYTRRVLRYSGTFQL